MANDIPKLNLVSNDGKDFVLYIDGKEVKGIRSLSVRCGIDEFMTHEVEYITAFSGGEINGEETS